MSSPNEDALKEARSTLNELAAYLTQVYHKSGDKSGIALLNFASQIRTLAAKTPAQIKFTGIASVQSQSFDRSQPREVSGPR